MANIKDPLQTLLGLSLQINMNTHTMNRKFTIIITGQLAYLTARAQNSFPIVSAPIVLKSIAVAADWILVWLL